MSYGIVDIANRIYLAAQVRAIEKGTEKITEGLLRSAYRDDFRLVSHIIETLKSGDPSLLHNVRDVCPPAIIPIKESAVNSGAGVAKEQYIEEETRDLDTTGDQAAPQSSRSEDAMIDMGKESNNMQRDQLFPSNVLSDVPTSKRKRRSRISKIIESSFEEKDLRGVIARSKASTPQVDPYCALRAVGYIKDSTEFLSKKCHEDLK